MDLLALIVLANFQKFLGVVRNDPINSFVDAPLHRFFIVDCPKKYRSLSLPDISQEGFTKGANHNLLKHVERDPRYPQELACIRDADANMCYRIAGQILLAEWKIVYLLGSVILFEAGYIES